MELLIKVAGIDNIIFASEMLGGVNAIDPASGKSFDDNRRFIDAISWLSEADRQKIFETNARKVYARLGVVRARA
jgi:4-oxalmesaconate hydratase